ncbi:MAG: YHS domain-containing (seleno)protein [Hyphomicrobiales bacterium]
MKLTRRNFLTASAGFALAPFTAGIAFAKGRIFNSGGKAIRGYDPVAYFKVGKPVKGKGKFSTKWQGATWRFASQENLDAFKKSPKKFAPVYGGYCSWAMSQGRIATTVPEAWDIVGGKLYLNFSLGIRRKWRTDIRGHIKQANRHWPKVSKTL